MHKGDEDAGTSIADMSDDETICGCNGVDKGTIVNAITSKGLTSVDEVTKATKAGNSCGKCKGQIGELLQYTLGDDFIAAKPTGICPCTDLTRDQIVTQIRAKISNHQKKYDTFLISKIKMVVLNVDLQLIII